MLVFWCQWVIGPYSYESCSSASALHSLLKSTATFLCGFCSRLYFKLLNRYDQDGYNYCAAEGCQRVHVNYSINADADKGDDDDDGDVDDKWKVKKRYDSAGYSSCCQISWGQW